ncbi:MAG: FecR domain-containing protein [Spirochaetota bacterium]
MKKLVFSVCIFCLFAAGAAAQSGTTAAYIIYSEGNAFTVSRDSKPKEYDVRYDDVIGMELQKGDFISTDQGTFLEIQLSQSRNILKISENTSFKIDKVQETGGGNFSLSYGRVRAKVEKLVGQDEFRISGPSVVAGVRGTDFGYDFIADQAGIQTGSVTQVYCFEGEVEVAKIEKVKEEVEGEIQVTEKVVEAVVITANEMIAIPEAKPETKLEPMEIKEEVQTFWKINDFIGTPLEIIPPPVTPQEQKPLTGEKEQEKPPEIQKPIQKEQQKEIITAPVKPTPEKRSLKKSFITAGTGFFTVGLAVESTGLLIYFFGDSVFPTGNFDTNRTISSVLVGSGAGLIGSALLSYLIALIVH